MIGATLDAKAVGYPKRSLTRTMLHAIVALVPGIALYALLIDSRVLSNLLIAVVTALMLEFCLIRMRKRPALPVLRDASIVLATMLLVLSVPQGLPLWQLIFGVFILCTLGKHVFGGLGQNPFNPAMVAFAVLIVSFPQTMTQWTTQQGFLDRHSEASDISTQAPETSDWDGVTKATPLDRLHTVDHTNNTSPQHTKGSSPAAINMTPKPSASQLILGTDWLWTSLAWLAGGLYLLAVRIINWRIPFAVLVSVWSLYCVYGWISITPVLSATTALFSGAIMFGAFFIATDPVSSATSNPGKLVYGIGVGTLCFVIREFSIYPEGMAFAVLLMNMCVPLIDHSFTRHRMTRKNSARGPNDVPPS